MTKLFFKVLLVSNLFLSAKVVSAQTSVTTITNPDPSQPANHFGQKVKLSPDGSTLVVSSPLQNVSVEGDSANIQTFSGMVTVFRRNLENDPDHWEEIGTFLNNDENALFGVSLDISGDGNRIVIGIPQKEGLGIGYFQVHEYNSIANSWSQLLNTILPGTHRERIGGAVAISDDGNTIVIGASKSNSPTGILANGAVDILVYNDSLFAYVYTQTLYPVWTQEGQNFGFDVDITGDGSMIAVGAPGYKSSNISRGSISVYRKESDSYVVYGAKTGSSNQLSIGTNIALEKVDGDDVFMISGNYSLQRAQIYNVSQPLWTLLDPFDVEFGTPYYVTDVDINSEGTVVIGDRPTTAIPFEGLGRVNWFEKQNDSWVNSGTLNALSNGPDEGFGKSVSISNRNATGDLFIAGGAPGGLPDPNTRYVRILRETSPFIAAPTSALESSIFPNPAYDELNILQLHEGDQIILLDEQGNKLYQTVVKRGQHDISVDIQELRLEPSIYYLKIYKENGEENIKRVVIK